MDSGAHGSLESNFIRADKTFATAGTEATFNNFIDLVTNMLNYGRPVSKVNMFVERKCEVGALELLKGILKGCVCMKEKCCVCAFTHAVVPLSLWKNSVDPK